MEDVAIAYGYNNLEITPPSTLTYGAQQPLNMLSDLLRYELAFAGYTEVLSFTLVLFYWFTYYRFSFISGVTNFENIHMIHSAPRKRISTFYKERTTTMLLLLITPRLKTFKY